MSEDPQLVTEHPQRAVVALLACLEREPEVTGCEESEIKFAERRRDGGMSAETTSNKPIWNGDREL